MSKFFLVAKITYKNHSTQSRVAIIRTLLHCFFWSISAKAYDYQHNVQSWWKTIARELQKTVAPYFLFLRQDFRSGKVKLRRSICAEIKNIFWIFSERLDALHVKNVLIKFRASVVKTFASTKLSKTVDTFASGFFNTRGIYFLQF